MNITSSMAGSESSTAELTASQIRIWTGQMLSPNEPLYNMAMAFQIEGKISASKFSDAFQKAVDENDALRTIFREHNGVPSQHIVDELRFETEFIDLSNSSSPAEIADKLLQSRAQEHFKLAERLFDSALLKLGSDRFVWFINQHHLICDGWSCAVLYQGVAHYYELSIDGKLGDPDKSKPRPQFLDYQITENNVRKSAEGREAIGYWAEKFVQDRPGLEMYGRRADSSSAATCRISYDIGQTRSEKLRALTKVSPIRSISPDLSLYYIFSALLFTYIHRVSGHNEMVIGSPSHNRSSLAHKETLGLFVELFPLCLTVTPEDTFRTLIESVIPEANSLLRNALPGASSEIPGDCYSVVLNYLSVSFADFCGMASHCSWIHSGFGDRGHALRLQVHDFDATGSFTLLFDLNEEIFPPSVREHAAVHFLNLVDALLDNLDTPIDQICLLGSKETEILTKAYNDTTVALPRDRTLLELVKEQVDLFPEAIAIAQGGSELSYRQLDQLSGYIALNLNKMGIGSDDIIAVFMRRSTSLIISLLGILKAGAAFAPIDTSFPQQRISQIIEDSKSPIVLTSNDLKSALASINTKIIDYEEISSDRPPSGPAPADPEDIAPRSLAYVIYTSGSTGRPKGVMIEHRSLLNYLCWARKEYMADGAHDFPLFSSVAADLTITSIFLPLISGSKVVVYPESSEGLDLSIMDVFNDDRVDIIKLTPSHLALLDGSKNLPARLKKLIVGGEDFKSGLARRVSSLYNGQITIYNEYGPTEATIGCMIYRFDPVLDTQSSVAIGRPIDNLRIYLLDTALNPVPVGVKGDLYIAGNGLARGYRNQSRMTAEKFVADPFHAGETMYCSGDIGRWRSAGVLDYLGRKDDQVKVRGFRIELGEIEAALCQIDGISESFTQIIERTAEAAEEKKSFCEACGLPSNVPRADLDENGICNPCRTFDKQRNLAEQYFKSENDLKPILTRAKQRSAGRYDCLMQYSGGKDSTFALYKLVEMGMRPLVFSFDNGFIPESAKDNIRRIVEDLELDLHWGETPAMNEIFVDSLRRFSNVCNGCQKVINTMSVTLASEHNVEYVFTGLSRGQSFETRVADLLNIGVVDIEEIDQAVIEARKAYHQMDDAVNKSLDVSVFADEKVFERIQFIDFYRYYDIPLAEVLEFLNTKTPWTRPADTGRSTNCLINEVGIHIHKKERGYHNYAAPYSWDVRLGHKQRDSALKELEDDIDQARVNRMLKEIGYDPDEKALSTIDRRIAAYYVGERDFTPEKLRSLLGRTLPAYMIPAYFLRMQSFPLNATGKVDHRALPLPKDSEQARVTEYKAPRSGVEGTLTEIWERVLGVKRIGINDNFFDLGGDSILNIQIVSRAVKAGVHITPALLFQNQTIAELAEAAASLESSESSATEPVDGPPLLSPIQHWYFNLNPQNPHCWNMSLSLKLPEDVVPEILEKAFQQLIDNHPSLRMRFRKTNKGWQPLVVGKEESFILERHTVSGEPKSSAKKIIDQTVHNGHASINIQQGPIIKVLLFENNRDNESQLFIIIHHLAVDGLSWDILLDDLQTAYQRLIADEPPDLLPEVTSVTQFSQKLSSYANLPQTERESLYWKGLGSTAALQIPRDTDQTDNGLESSAEKVIVKLKPDETNALRHQLPGNEQVSVEEILLSSLVKALHTWTGSSFIRIDKEGHGREELIEGANLLRTTGWFTSLFPVNFIVPAVQDGRQFLQAIKQQVRSIPNRGFSYGPLSFLNTNPQINEDLKFISQSEILFNHLGDLGQLSGQSTLFSISSPIELFRAPEEKRSYLLEIASFVFDGQLEAHLTYSRDCHRTDTIEALANDFLSNLIELVGNITRLPAKKSSFSDKLSHIADAPPLPQQNVSDSYPLTPLQSGILFHTLKEPDSGVYVEQYSCTIEGDFDSELFQHAWNQILDHHSILRTSFIWERSEDPLQVINDSVVLGWYHKDFRGKSTEEISKQLDEFLAKDRQKGFSLNDAPLMRCALFNIDEAVYRWIWSFHHIICDGWSTSRILNEVFECYDSLRSSLQNSLPAQRPFRDFVYWQLQQDQSAARKYWQEQLKGFYNPTSLSIQSFDASLSGYDKQELDLSEELTASLTSVAQASRLTLNTVIQGVWAILLHRYSGDSDIIFGTTVSGRPHSLEGADSMIGLFINTLPFRICIDQSRPLAAWLAEILLKQVESRDYEFSSLVNIHEWSDFQPGVPLFDSIVVFENYPTQLESYENARDYSIRNIAYLEQSNYPLSIIAVPARNLKIMASYDRRQFSKDTISRLLGHLRILIQQFVENPDKRLGDLSLLSEQELEALAGYHGRQSSLPAARTVQNLLEVQSTSSPKKDAIIFRSTRLNYQELYVRINQLAHYLIEQDFPKGTVHAVFIDRSVEMVIAMLAILKSGSAYLPLDPDYPEKRLEFMLSDAQPATVLTVERMASKLPNHDAKKVCIDSETIGLDQYNKASPDISIGSEDIAYIIYTSGSTGPPKGVMISHRNLYNSTSERMEYYKTPPERFLLLSSISFDSSVAGIFGTLCAGGALYIPKQAHHRDIRYLADLIDLHKISQILAIPSLYDYLLRYHAAKISSLKTVIVAGEPCGIDLIETHWSTLPGTKLFNEYGPTEATVWSTVFDCRESYQGNTVPIGKPISNMKVFVLDKWLRQVPPGIAGELYLGGANISPGYLKRPKLTSERFLQLKLPGYEEQRVYKTGDIVRFLDNGSLVFMGRNDEQIKMRGYRIELGEIESVLASEDCVKNVAVVPKFSATQKNQTGSDYGANYNTAANNGTAKLRNSAKHSISLINAFVVPHEKKTVDTSLLKTLLGKSMPNYMIPSEIIVVDSLPLTPNGKIDRKALQHIVNIRKSYSSSSIAPSTKIEKAIANIWCDILCLNSVGISDNFFSLGGHSLLLIKLASGLEKKFSSNISISDLFQTQTIEQQANLLIRKKNSHNSTESSPHFFWIHGDESNRALSNYLDQDFKLHIITHQSEDGKAAKFKTVESITDHYLKEIRLVQSLGPYFLGGYCSGGIIAFEAAQRLVSEGEEVALLFLLDPSEPYETLKGEPKKSSKQIVSKKRRSNSKDSIANFLRMPRNTKIRKIRAEIKSKLINYRFMAAKILVKSGIRLPADLRTKYILEIYNEAIKDYSPAYYPGNILIFLCDDPNIDNESRWYRLQAKNKSIYRISKSLHSDILLEPHIDVWTQQLNSDLKNV